MAMALAMAWFRKKTDSSFCTTSKSGKGSNSKIIFSPQIFRNHKFVIKPHSFLLHLWGFYDKLVRTEYLWGSALSKIACILFVFRKVTPSEVWKLTRLALADVEKYRNAKKSPHSAIRKRNRPKKLLARPPLADDRVVVFEVVQQQLPLPLP